MFISRISSRLKLALVAAAATLLWTMAAAPVAPAAASAREFDLTGTLDCDDRSGRKCHFVDWEAGPVLAIFTEDISGVRERRIVDVSWVRDDMDGSRQDDFVWFTVADLGGEFLQATGVVEYRCTDGTYSHGIVNQGQSNGDRCR
jgi:hypothetical protein